MTVGIKVDSDRTPEQPLGAIDLTITAESGLHSPRLLRQLLNEAGQLNEIVHPERRPSVSHHNEHVRLGGIRPPHGQRVLDTVLVEEEHPVITPRLADTTEDEPLTAQRMERMRDQNSPVLTVPIGRS